MSKQRKCWATAFGVFKEAPVWNQSDHYWYIKYKIRLAHTENLPPQIEKMIKKALKGKRGKNAICECVWETWVPIIEAPHFYCYGNGKVGRNNVDCQGCKGTGKTKRPMEAGDL